MGTNNKVEKAWEGAGAGWRGSRGKEKKNNNKGDICKVFNNKEKKNIKARQKQQSQLEKTLYTILCSDELCFMLGLS